MSGFSYFRDKFYEKTGLDLDCYKEGQMQRRIKQFMQRYKAESYAHFWNLLEKNVEIMNSFKSYLTINTSSFFRDPQIYSALQEKIIPAIVKQFKKIEIWSAACSTGEEPYSLVMMLTEMGLAAKSRIEATDLDYEAIKAAKTAIYHEKQLEPVPQEYRHKYFCRKGEHQYELCPEIKRMVIFKRANLLKTMERKDYHLLLCRNLFIYLKPQVQERLLSSFMKNLLQGGFFVIGSAEYISSPAKFGLEKVEHAIYRRVK